MNVQTNVKGNWHEFKGVVKENWGRITDNDLTRIDGQKEKLIGAVMKRYGLSVDEAKRAVTQVWRQYE